jgi:release factor glutamine methyltransferase
VRVAEALREAALDLANVSDTSRLDAELLMAHALGSSRSDMLLGAMNLPVPQNFAELLDRRQASEPIAYILGHQEFYGRRFAVTRDVLIPRSDSETVIEAALASIGEEGFVLDLGTGSGALLLTLLAEREGLRGLGIDASAAALDVAKNNAAHLGLADRADFKLCAWRKDHSGGASWTNGLPKADLVIANPPYVESGARLAPDVLDFEPHSALFAGPEGLDDYRIIIPALTRVLRVSGAAVLEIGAEQGKAAAQLAHNAGFKTHLSRDLAGRARALTCTL